MTEPTLRDALERIANLDYRGNRSPEQDIARAALAATPPPPLDGLDPAEQERLRVEFFGLQTPTGDET